MLKYPRLIPIFQKVLLVYLKMKSQEIYLGYRLGALAKGP